MRVSDGRLLVSPTDVVDVMACTHRAATALRVAHGFLAPPASSGLTSVMAAGQEHEARVVADLTAGADVVDLTGPTPDLDAWQLLAHRTAHELRHGTADVLLQAGVLVDLDGAAAGGAAPDAAVLVGRPDLLVRTPSGWRVEEAKLSRSVTPSALLQTSLYRDALTAAGVAVHDDLRLHLGDGRCVDVPARTVAAWARRQLTDVHHRLVALVAGGALRPGYTPAVVWCATCDDASPCGRARAAARHLGGVADLRRAQADRLAAAGITTIPALAAASGPVPGMALATVAVLREQAQLQEQARATGTIPVRVLDHPAQVREGDVRPGLWLVPDPDPGDVFFDMEGDPLWTAPAPTGATGQPGLEYLFGASHDTGGFTAFWAHDRTGEGRAFADFVDWVQARRAAHPGLHVFHYAAYEKTALKRLASQHATRGDVIDEWLAGGVLVDLYTAVRGGLRAGVPSYSIKKVEALYGVTHTGDVADAAASIDAYEAYRASGDDTVLKQIEDYNRDDCDSTRDLRDYLLTLRATAVADGRIPPLRVEPAPLVDEEAADGSAPSKAAELRARLAARALELLDGADPSTASEDPAAEARRVLAGLLGHQVREEKAAWQDVFRVAEEVSVDETAAVDDAKVIGGLVPAGAVPTSGSALAWAFTAPAQQHGVKTGRVLGCVAGRPVSMTVTGLDTDDAGALRVTATTSAAVAAAGRWSPDTPPPVDALLPDELVRAEAQQTSLLELADTTSGPDPAAVPAPDDPAAPRAAARALLLGCASLTRDELPPALEGEDGVAHAVRLLRAERGLCLAVQGPPGAGKSYLGAEAVDALVADARATGRPVRIGVTANSHKVVQHLLRAVHARTPAARVRHFDGTHPKGKDPATWTRHCQHDGCAEPLLVTGNRTGWAGAEVLGGTAWAFARDDAPPLDVLVIDEAGQMALGDVLACARQVGNLLLLGDPQQLAKPSRAAHPDGVAVSALTHLMRGRATMPPEVGIFLDATRRMHPDVARFISDIAYDARLTSHAVCSTRAVEPLDVGDALAGTGLRAVPVEHTGNAQTSAEEVAVVVELVRELLRRSWRQEGEVAAMDAGEVLVVSPFNAQVRVLEEALARCGLGAVRVGTVDKLQGQEAAAVVYSTAASDAESAPRGLGFLYDLHRLNVAISRARCLAFWVGSPQLLRPRVTSAEQVPLVNALCRFAEDAVEVGRPVTGRSGSGATDRQRPHTP